MNGPDPAGTITARRLTPEPIPPREIVGNAEVRHLCGDISRHTLIRWREQRDFPAPARVLRLSKTELWDARHVRAWLKIQETNR